MNFEERLGEGFELLKEKDIDTSLDIARELQKEDDSNPEPFYLEGLIMQQLNQWDMSIKVLDKAVELNAQEARYVCTRGFAYMQKEDLETAEKDFDSAISLDNTPPIAHRYKVMLMLMTDRGEEASPYLIDRIRNNPQDAENWILMGDMLNKAGQGEKAYTYYEQALKIDPDNEYARTQLEK